MGLLFCLFAPQSVAELEPSSIQFKLGSRYDTKFLRENMHQTTSRFQFQATIGYALGLVSSPAGDFTLRGVAGTGGSYTSAWNTFATTNGQSVSDQVFNMRQIYLQDVIEGWVAQAGIIPPNSGDIPTLGYDSDGWVRGARLVAPLGEGDLQLVTGAIDHLSDPNAFNGWEEWNYFGTKLVQPLPWWELEGAFSYEYIGNNGVDYLQDSNYLGAELTRIWELDEGMDLKGGLEALYNFSQPSWAWAAAAKLKTEPVDIGIAYTFINPRFGLRGELSNDFFTLGHRFSIDFSGEALIDGFKWFAKTDVTEQQLRFRVGFTYKFGGTAPGYLVLFD